jgi:hypothetical protein
MKKIIFINVVVVIFILFIFEFTANFLQLSNLQGIEPGLIDNSKNKIHKMIPNSSGIHFGKEIFIDKNGFRVPKKNYKYNKSSKSIFIIGDSTTFGNGITEENTFIGMLRKKFKKWDFYNTAVPGYNIRHFNENLNQIDDFENIKKVFYFITLNDVYGGESIVDLGKKKKNNMTKNDKKITIFKHMKDISIINKLNAYLRNKSYLYMFLKGVATDPSERYFINILDAYSKNDLKHMNDYVFKLNEKLLDKKIELKIIILPYEFQTRNCTNKNLMPQNKISKILTKLEINFSDYSNSFCHHINPKSLFYKFDPMHLSKKGHSLVFDLIKNEI